MDTVAVVVVVVVVLFNARGGLAAVCGGPKAFSRHADGLSMYLYGTRSSGGLPPGKHEYASHKAQRAIFT